MNQFPIVSVDLDDPKNRDQVAETMLVDIDEWCEEHYREGHRRHLGGSQIGKNCARALWYAFRWVKTPSTENENSKRTEGQMQRLFNRGHREEASIIEYLRGIGCVIENDPEDQIRISDCGGHFGGSLDNVGYLPPKFNIPHKVLFEFKTANMTEFSKLKKAGVKSHKPEHWSQMCVYAFKAELDYAVYVCVDKNSDEIYIEVLKIDHDYGQLMIDKAGAIITARTPPQKIAIHSTHFACKWCQFKEICHHDAPVEKNCRSCINAVPLEDRRWGCELYGEIPDHIVPIGCDNHQGVD